MLGWRRRLHDAGVAAVVAGVAAKTLNSYPGRLSQFAEFCRDSENIGPLEATTAIVVCSRISRRLFPYRSTAPSSLAPLSGCDGCRLREQRLHSGAGPGPRPRPICGTPRRRGARAGLLQASRSVRRLPVLAAALAEDTSVASSMDDDMDSAGMYAEFAEMLEPVRSQLQAWGPRHRAPSSVSIARGAYVDIGAKGAGYVPSNECSMNTNVKANEVLTVETQREFLITKDNAKDGEIGLSLRQLEYSVAWQRVRQLQEEDVTVMGKVLSLNRGGLLVDVETSRALSPTSQLGYRVNAENSMGMEIPLKFLEVDEERQRLVFSNRKAVTEIPTMDFKVGDVVEGIVESIRPFGAFINLGETNGLLHISQISHERVNAVENVLTPGDRLKVMILSKDREKGRVALS
eukprot:jgi/Tetstr1/428860/TSEL_018847.t1